MDQDAEEGEIIPGAIKAGEYRASIATRDLKQWVKKVDLLYHSPHKFRHGNAVYSIMMARDVAALKAVSQNLMHSNLSITDGIYGILSDIDMKSRIISLKESRNYENPKEDIVRQLKKVITQLENKEKL